LLANFLTTLGHCEGLVQPKNVISVIIYPPSCRSLFTTSNTETVVCLVMRQMTTNMVQQWGSKDKILLIFSTGNCVLIFQDRLRAPRLFKYTLVKEMIKYSMAFYCIVHCITLLDDFESTIFFRILRTFLL